MCRSNFQEPIKNFSAIFLPWLSKLFPSLPYNYFENMFKIFQKKTIIFQIICDFKICKNFCSSTFSNYCNCFPYQILEILNFSTVLNLFALEFRMRFVLGGFPAHNPILKIVVTFFSSVRRFIRDDPVFKPFS